MSNIDVFISAGTTSTESQEAFITAIENRLKSENLTPNTVGRNKFSADSPLKTVIELMNECSGTIIVALERTYFPNGVERRGGVKEKPLSDIKYATSWNQIEAALAYSKEQPILVIIEEGLKSEGLLEKGYDWYVMSVKPEVSVLTTNEFNGVLSSWKKKVEDYNAKKNPSHLDKNRDNKASLTNAELLNAKESETVGKTIWDLLGNLFTKKPTIVVSTLVGVAFIFLILIFTGLLKFEMIDGKVSMAFNPTGQNTISQTSENSSDQLVSFCLAKGTELKKKYVLKSIVQTYDAELIGKSKDTLVVKERIIYDILALQDIAKAENIFKEGYSSNVAFKVERWFGNEREKLLHMGNESTFYVHFECKKGESITMMTGADFYYTFPLKDNRFSPFRDYKLASNEDLWIYPNEEDVIGKLTMIWSSHDIKLQQISGAAFHTLTTGKTNVNDDKDAFYNLDENSVSKNNSVSATWKNILPDEQFALKIKW